MTANDRNVPHSVVPRKLLALRNLGIPKFWNLGILESWNVAGECGEREAQIRMTSGSFLGAVNNVAAQAANVGKNRQLLLTAPTTCMLNPFVRL